MQHAGIKISALFQCAMMLFCQKNLFRSCKIKFVLTRGRRNENWIWGLPINMQGWAYEIICSNSFSERGKKLNYIVFCHIQFAHQREAHEDQLWPWEVSSVVTTPCRAPLGLILPAYPNQCIGLSERKTIIVLQFQTANPSRFSLLPNRISPWFST